MGRKERACLLKYHRLLSVPLRR